MATMQAKASEYESADWVPPVRRFVFLKAILQRKIATVACVYLLLFYAFGVLAPFLAPHDPNKQELTVEARFQRPNRDHLLGTDQLGRDIASRAMYAARTTIIFTVVVIFTGSFLIGVGLGLLAGYRGGHVDTAIMRIGEVMGGVPTLILIIALTAAFRTRINDVAFWLKDTTFLGDDAKTLVKFSVIILATLPFSWIGSCRITRAQALGLREQEFVAAAEAIGAGTWRIVWRHIFPGILPLFLVGLSGGMAGLAATEVGLSYLGLGIDPPTASFGSMIGDASGTRLFEAHPHMLLASATPVILFFFAWNLLGDALVDIVQPRNQRR